MQRTIGFSLILAVRLLVPLPAHALQVQAPAPPMPSGALFVVDGWAIPADSVKQVDPALIESVNVLKGQAAVDQYGELGRAGVVEITTKAGVKKPTPSFPASHLQAVEELLHALGQDSMMRQAAPMMSAMRQQGMGGSGIVDAMEEFFAKYLRWDDIKGDIIPIYAAAFTEPEVRELIAFYKSPVGAKYVLFTPDVSAKTMEVTQRRLEPHMNELMQIMMRRGSP